MYLGDLFHWPDGAGWIILSGGNSAASIVRAGVLMRSGPGPIAYICADGNSSSAQNSLEDMASLGAPSGYLVNAAIDEPDAIRELLAEAGIIVLDPALSPHEMVEHLQGFLNQALITAYENGAMILAEATSASAFGSWLIEDGELLPALCWLDDALITTTGEAQTVDGASLASLHLHIPAESALALGPAGQVELWGNQDVQITLGSEHSS